MNENVEKLNREDESRGKKIARIVAKLPEREQDKIYYILKGIELVGNTRTNVPRAAVQ